MNNEEGKIQSARDEQIPVIKSRRIFTYSAGSCSLCWDWYFFHYTFVYGNYRTGNISFLTCHFSWQYFLPNLYFFSVRKMQELEILIIFPSELLTSWIKSQYKSTENAMKKKWKSKLKMVDMYHQKTEIFMLR